MSNFKYKRNRLYCEDIEVSEIAKNISTPAYVYSYQSIVDKYKELKSAFANIKPLICFSMKANSNLSICRILTEQGAGLDIVSGGELYRAAKVKADFRRIVFAGAGKTEQEIREALKLNILLINAESKEEVEKVNTLAGGLKKKVQIALRVNPNVSGGAHQYIQTAKKENKFGISLEEAKKIFLQRKKFIHLNICGIHFHLGSQITTNQPFTKALKKVIPFLSKLRKQGIEIKYLDIGGGFFQSAKQFAQAILPLLSNLNICLIMEPGRFLIAESGILLTKVLYLKKRKTGKNFIIVDAAMNDFIRPSLYNVSHRIVPLKKTPITSSAKGEVRQRRQPAVTKRYDIVGPVCESGDFLAKNVNVPFIKTGDFLAIMDTGAYGFAMASNYNSRPRPAEVLVKKNKFYLIREREEYKDLIRKEKLVHSQ